MKRILLALALLVACADPTGDAPTLAKGAAPGRNKPRVIRGEIYPAGALTPAPGETRQACAFYVWSDSARRLSADQVGIAFCDSLATIYTRSAVK